MISKQDDTTQHKASKSSKHYTTHSKQAIRALNQMVELPASTASTAYTPDIGSTIVRAFEPPARVRVRVATKQHSGAAQQHSSTAAQ